MMLCMAGHQQQAAVCKRNALSRAGGLLFRPQQKVTCTAQTDAGYDRLVSEFFFVIGMPAHAVVAITI